MFVFDPKTLKPFLNDAKPPELCPKYCFFYPKCQIFVNLFAKNTKKGYIYASMPQEPVEKKRTSSKL